MPAIGDKMASRSGQKGTVGMVIREEDMPFTRDGVRPDLIINPHAIPTRMTIGQLVECITGKACLLSGTHGDCTAFTSDDSQLAPFGRMLSKAGLHSSGNEVLYNGMTGEQIEAEIFMGPTYYMRLKHMVKDKVNFRATGPRTGLTRQPVSGRANDGGLRIGEMERDSIISHGATDFLRESMLVRGDQYYMAVCNKTGGVAIYNPEKNLFLSPLADGPIKYTDSLDGKSMNVEQVSKYGRSFSVVRVPYVFKLFMQELQTINVKMAIITEDNVDQFDSMNFSANISLLSGLSTPGDVSRKILDDKDNAEVMKERKKRFQDKQQTPTPGSVKNTTKGHWENYLKFKGLPMDFEYDDAAIEDSPAIEGSPRFLPRTPPLPKKPDEVVDTTMGFWQDYLKSKGLPADFEYDAEVMSEQLAIEGFDSKLWEQVPSKKWDFEAPSLEYLPRSPAISPKGPGIPYGPNVPANYDSMGQILYNEETGLEYVYDPVKGHYIDPITGYIVVRKDFLVAGPSSLAQGANSLAQGANSLQVGETVYSFADPSSPLSISSIEGNNIITKNLITGENKVVSTNEITRVQPQSPDFSPPQMSPQMSPQTQTPAIHFQPNIIVSTGANSQVSTPNPTDTVVESPSLSPSPSPSPSAPPLSSQSDFFDKPQISKQKADSNTNSLLSGGSFTVKMV